MAGDMSERTKTLLAFVFLLLGCGERSNLAHETAPAAAASAPALRGMAIGRDGFATIINVPPAPFRPTEPGTPQPLTADQLAGHARFARASRFQHEVRAEVEALTETLRRREKGNFVDLYYENEGEPRVVFRFLRDAAATLAKYTKHPRFLADTARYSDEELRAAMDFMLETFRKDRVILGGGTGNKRNRAVVEVAVTEPEFRALAAKKGVTIPAAVELQFAARQPASAVNRPLAPEIARLVRIFPRDNRPVGALHSIDSRGKVVLRDGCFRFSGGSEDGGLVLFPLGAQLFIDKEGYLSFGRGEAPGYARVGETIVTPGTIAEVSAPDLVQPIRQACGFGKVLKIHAMRSEAADRAQQAVSTNAQALRQFKDSYGLSEAVARKALERCKARSGFGVCMISPPPPPPPGGPVCPGGSKPSFGMCRTPEGHIRPIPAWIQELVKD